MHPLGIILTLHAISAPAPKLLKFTNYFLSHTRTYPVPKYSADRRREALRGLAPIAPAEAPMYRLIGELSPIFCSFLFFCRTNEVMQDPESNLSGLIIVYSIFSEYSSNIELTEKLL